MQLRTEFDIKRLMRIWDGRPFDNLRFTQIKEALGWNSRKTAYLLAKAVEEGFLEKIEEKPNKVFYKCKLADYNGYFSALDFVKKIDNLCRRHGLVWSSDYYLYTFVPFHVLAYGIGQPRDLTPIEEEMLGAILGRMVSAFSDYVRLCDAVKNRALYEENKSLPDEVKGNLFAEHEGETEEERLPSLDVTAAHAIYGDVLWEHIFHKIVHDLRFALEKGSLDFTGPEELMAIRDRIINLALNLAKRIYQGEFSRRYEGDQKIVDDLGMLFHLFPDFRSDLQSRAYGVILTPSPRTIDEYTEQIGNIVQDSFKFWSQPEIFAIDVKKKGASIWEDHFDINGKLISRKKLFWDDLIDKISVMREHKEEVISSVDEKFMMLDSRLRKVFTEDEIKNIIDSVRSLIKRVRKFHQMTTENVSMQEMEKDPEWFAEEELHAFKVAERVKRLSLWKHKFGTNGPIKIKFPVHDKKIKKLLDDYMHKVRKELRKY